jgi:hypothetical protein
VAFTQFEHGLPGVASDDDLLAWSRELLSRPTRRRRAQPLRAQAPAAAAPPVEKLTIDEVFAEVEARVKPLRARPRVKLRRRLSQASDRL